MKKFLAFVLAIALFVGTSSVSLADNQVYALYVNTAQNVVTVMTIDALGVETPYKAMLCSTARSGHVTPLGTYATNGYYDWCYMVDGTWGRYSVRFNGPILFHSVPYLAKSVDTLEWDQFNKLGEAASLGCVRLSVADAKWIYDNCKYGTKVVVYSDPTSPGPLGKPTGVKIDANSPNRGWDPTDPSPSNPWNGGVGLVVAPANLTYNNFDYRKYADTYGDLKLAFGYDRDLLWYHYNYFGKKEGRVVSTY